jgi:hypothetical protein
MMPLLTIVPNASRKPRRSRWEALVSLPLTGLVLLAGLLLALMAVVGGARAHSEEAAPALEQPASPAAAGDLDDAVERKLQRSLRLAVTPFGDQLYVLQPVQLLSAHDRGRRRADGQTVSQ